MDVYPPPFNEEQWVCRKHTFQLRHGVCPGCLSGRLLLLCPDCSSLRPCGCLPSSSSSSSHSSLLSLDPPRSSIGSLIGEIGPVGCLIDGEPAFRRSRSAPFQFLKSRLSRESDGDRGGRRWTLFRLFAKRKGDGEIAPERLQGPRSAAERMVSGVGNVGSAKGKGWKWRFRSHIRALHSRKSAKAGEENPQR